MIVDGFDTDQLQRQRPEVFRFGGIDPKALANPKLWVSLYLAVSSLLVAALAAVIMSSRTQPQALSLPMQVQAEVQQAQAHLDQTTYRTTEAITRTDLNPVFAQNPGIIQKFVLNAAAAFRERVIVEQAKSGKHEAEIVQDAIARATQKMAIAAAGQNAVLVYKNAEGKTVQQTLYANELAALAQVELLKAKYESRPTQQRFNTTEVIRESLTNEKLQKCHKARSLSVQGLRQVAMTLLTTDIFGRTIDPTDENTICPVSDGGVQ